MMMMMMMMMMDMYEVPPGCKLLVTFSPFGFCLALPILFGSLNKLP